MKKQQSIIPLNLREEMSKDSFYKSCALFGQEFNGVKHECEGNITWEHTLIFAGKKIQEKWAIIPLCEKYHGVNWFQDSGYLTKEINVWVALNRASEDDLKRFSKAINYNRERNRLNALYSQYVPKVHPVKILQNHPASLMVDDIMSPKHREWFEKGFKQGYELAAKTSFPLKSNE